MVAGPQLSGAIKCYLSRRLKKPEEEMKSQIEKSTIPLDHAVLCLDCSCVSDANRECPACSSRALMNLSVVLNRGEEFVCTGELAAA